MGVYYDWFAGKNNGNGEQGESTSKPQNTTTKKLRLGRQAPPQKGKDPRFPPDWGGKVRQKRGQS